MIFKNLVIVTFVTMTFSSYGATKNSPQAICAKLLEGGGGVFLSSGRPKFSDPENFKQKMANASQPLVEILAALPFAHDLVDDIPAFLEFSWKRTNSHVSAEIYSEGQNTLQVDLDERGLLDLKIMCSADLAKDSMLFERVIQTLQNCKIDALLFARSSILPAAPEDGYALWITRMDGGRKKVRSCVGEILGLFGMNNGAD